MKVILLSKVYKLGSEGDQVKVNAGYARNFLIPFGKAIIATKENLYIFENQKKQKEKEIYNKILIYQKTAKKILALQPIIIYSKSGEEGKLFGSIGIRDISDAINRLGIAVNKNDFRLLNGSLKTIGEHTVLFCPHVKVRSDIIIKIVS
ncbi:50S ribosomal protein L9 [Buchnera aphidicola (Thelaxes suberi)]|uniref:50S ribosomal protein L9 n=1 Tax=Buchnera aphidicola TaxID=9 RepID=UPI003463E190